MELRSFALNSFGDRVAVDGVASGTTNSDGVFSERLFVGSHQVAVSKDRYQQETDFVEISVGQIAQLRMSLAPIDTWNIPASLGYPNGT